VVRRDWRGLFRHSPGLSAILRVPAHDQQVFGHQTPQFDGRSSVVTGGAQQMDRQPGNNGWHNTALRLRLAGLLSDGGRGRRGPETPALHCGKIDQESTKRIICFPAHILLRRS
jgi:hypothetical protein